jgi:hypothetical protein
MLPRNAFVILRTRQRGRQEVDLAAHGQAELPPEPEPEPEPEPDPKAKKAKPKKVRKYLIICALSYTPHTNLHINKSREA